MGAVNDTTRAVLKSLQLAYYAGLKDLVDSGIFERDDFTVALQHHLVNIELQATVRTLSAPSKHGTLTL